jgi:hypothetical protein
MNTLLFVRRFHSLFTVRLILLMALMLAWRSTTFGDEIHDAAVNGDAAKVSALLKDNPSLASSRDEYGRTPLHRAALLGHKGVIELLLANKPDVNAKDSCGRTAADIAGIGGYHEVIALLRQHSRQEAAIAATATAKPVATNAVATVTTKPPATSPLPAPAVTAKPVATPQTTPEPAKPVESKTVVTSPKGKTDATPETRNYGRIGVRPRKNKDATELLRDFPKQSELATPGGFEPPFRSHPFNMRFF